MSFKALSTVQIGRIGENILINEIMAASSGRISPFNVVADDDGVDVILHDKVKLANTLVQVKVRTGKDNDGRVQFDITRKTFNSEREGFCLLLLLKHSGSITVEQALLIQGKRGQNLRITSSQISPLWPQGY